MNSLASHPLRCAVPLASSAMWLNALSTIHSRCPVCLTDPAASYCPLKQICNRQGSHAGTAHAETQLVVPRPVGRVGLHGRKNADSPGCSPRCDRISFSGVPLRMNSMSTPASAAWRMKQVSSSSRIGGDMAGTCDEVSRPACYSLAGASACSCPEIERHCSADKNPSRPPHRPCRLRGCRWRA